MNQVGDSGSIYTEGISTINNEWKQLGGIKIGKFKRVKLLLYSLFSFLQYVTPQMLALHTIITIIRILQVLGSTIPIHNKFVYKSDSLVLKTLKTISCTYNIIPKDDYSSIIEPILFSYSAFLGAFFVLIIISSFILVKHGKLSMTITILVALFIRSIGYIIHYPVSIFCSDALVLIVNNQYPTRRLSLIVSLICSIVSFILYYIMYSRVFSVSIQFNPDSLMCLNSRFSSKLLLNTFLIGFMANIIDQTNGVVKYLSVIIVLLLNLSLLYRVFVGSSLIFDSDKKYLCTAFLFELVVLLIPSLTQYFGILLDESFIVLLVFLYYLLFNLSDRLIKMKKIKHFLSLDLLDSDPDVIGSWSNHLDLIDAVIVGYSNSHPICFNMKVFDNIIEFYSNNPLVLCSFAKLVSIFPDESSTLEWIKRKLDSIKKKKSYEKFLSLQIKTVIQRRESNLTPSLKRNLNELSKKGSNTKSRIKNLWDIILQGHIPEIDASLKRAYLSSQTSHRDYNHLIIQYPNNCYVTRAYANFQKEILSDQVEYYEWIEKTRQLKMGKNILSDITSELGILVFPQLPSSMRDHIETKKQIEIELSFTPEIDQDDGIDSNKTRFNKYLLDRVSSVHIPAVRINIMISILFIIIIVLVPIMFLVSNINSYITNVMNPLDLMMSISHIRVLCFQFSCFANRWVMEILPVKGTNKSIFQPIDYGNYKPQSLGGFTDTKRQIEHLTKIAPLVAQRFNRFSSYQVGNSVFDQIRKLCFQQSIEYEYYANSKSITIVNMSIQNILIDVVMQISSFIKNEAFNESYLDQPHYLNLKSGSKSGEKMNLALLLLTQYLEETDQILQKSYSQYQYVYLASIIIVFIIGFYYSSQRLKKEKLCIYKCLTSLPKGVVGSIIENMRILNKDGVDGSKRSSSSVDISKQEETILKLFNSASEFSWGSTSFIQEFLLNFIIIICSIYSFFSICELYQIESSIMTKVSPHIDYLLGLSGYVYGIFSNLNSMVLTMSGYKIFNPTAFPILARMSPRMLDYKIYFHNLRFGNDQTNRLPYIGIKDGLSKSAELSKCSNSTEMQFNMINMFFCNNADINIIMFENLINRIIHPFSQLLIPIKPKESFVDEAWFLGSIMICDTYLYPMFETIMARLEGQLVETITPSLIPIFYGLIFVLILEIFLINQIYQNQKLLQYCLSLLAHCPQNVISTNKRIMKVLSGDFSNTDGDLILRNSCFYSKLIENLADGIIAFSDKGIIELINASCGKLFNINPKDYINQNISSFITLDRFKHDQNEIMSNGRNHDGFTIQLNHSDSKTHIHLSVFQSNTNNIIIMKDISMTVNYNQLINDEKAKSDMILTSILPSSLVPRVLRNESNIAFSIQSATIIFIDIVNFTPWCSKNGVNRVMNVLNTIFRDFDSLLSTHPTMTKIKCIGDCYMAAGGIFCENNHPSKHAKEVIDFGLEAIDSIKNINERLGESIEIRVGINTGGPIIAGVLGVSKPTFEILGSPINIAQQMEHNGIPMQLHISRSVYEIIYGNPYKIKERGQMEIKGVPTLTYLISH